MTVASRLAWPIQVGLEESAVAPRPASGAVPDVFAYSDHLQFLRDVFQHHKSRSLRFSHRYVAAKAGFKSSSVLTNIFSGRRRLSAESAERFAEAFHLSANAKRYFLALVRLNQSRAPGERLKNQIELWDLRRMERPGRLPEHAFEALSSWWTLAIREMVGLPDFRECSDWIAGNLVPRIEPAQAESCLAALENSGLIRRDRGRLAIAQPALAADPDPASPGAARLLQDLIGVGAESIGRIPSRDREVSGTVLRLSRKDMELVKVLWKQFRLRLMNIALLSQDADQVYAVNFQLFPLAATDRAATPWQDCAPGRKGGGIDIGNSAG